MEFDKSLVAGKLRRWEKYLDNYRLPKWEDIPNFGLYMEQVIALLQDYLDYLPEELKEEQFITAATINNYVRKKVMPEPIKKKYFREHIAYLIIICTMKQCLSIPTLQTMLPPDLSSEVLQEVYTSYVERHRMMALFFIEEVRSIASPILDHETIAEVGVTDTNDLIISCAILSGFTKLLAEKLLLLEGKDLTNGGTVEVKQKSKKKK